MPTVNIVRKVDYEKQFIAGVKEDLDYQLASLNEAMKRNDTEEIAKIKEELKDIHAQLTAFDSFN